MFEYSSISKEHKVDWLKQWNEFGVLREAKKIPKAGLLRCSIRQMVAQGTILAPSYTSKFLV